MSNFDIQMYAKAKLDFDQPDRVWLLCQGEYIPFRRERTCRNTHKNRWFSCSECGFGFMDMFACDERDIEEQPHYCPNCGAKVVQS